MSPDFATCPLGVKSSLVKSHCWQFRSGWGCLSQPQCPRGSTLNGASQWSFFGTQNLSTSPGPGYPVLTAHGFYTLITQRGNPRSSLTPVHSGWVVCGWGSRKRKRQLFPPLHFYGSQTILTDGNQAKSSIQLFPRQKLGSLHLGRVRDEQWHICFLYVVPPPCHNTV